MRNILIILILVLVTGCGFKPIYSSNKINFSIIDIEFKNNLLNKKISDQIKRLSNNDSENKFSIKLETKKEKLIKAKNKKNIPSIFELKIQLNLTVIDSTGEKKLKKFSKQSKYNYNEDKFQLSRYEKELENTLVNQLVLEVHEFLSNE